MQSSFAPIAYIISLLVAIPAFGQFIEAPTPPPPPLGSLDLPPVKDRVSGLPLVDEGGGGFIKDEAAAILLGKALFWDTQAGSNDVACATCHYHAGADNRIRNQLSPGIKGGNGTFDITNTGGGGPNYDLTAGDFPLHKLSIPDVRNSAVINDIDDVVSSQGTFAANFNDVEEGEAIDDCDLISPDPFGFHLNNINVRRVEPRNTPTIINAAFNHRNFWDGRANNIFNGVDNSGLRNDDATIITNKGGTLKTDDTVQFENSSLASQSVIPIVSDFEMSCAGRVFPKVGKKMLSLEALANQRVHPNDSVLGGVSAHPKDGLDGPGNSGIPYTDLVEAAFADWLWDSNAIFDIDGNQVGTGNPSGTDEYSQMESNFALLWGLSIMAYERTLISDDTPFDQWSAANEADGGQEMPIADGKSILTDDEVAGMNLFFTNTVGARGLCSTCHQGPAFSTATFPFSIEEESGEFPEQEQLVERMKMGDAFTITENLLRFSTSGTGSIGGYAIDGAAGSWNLPDTYPATTGGDITVNGVTCDVYSYLTNQDTIQIPTGSFPPFIEVPNTATRDSVFVLRNCGDWLQVTIVEGGPNNDSGTVQVIAPIVKQPPQSDPLPIMPIGAPVSGAVDGDFTLNGPTLYDTAFYNIGVRPTAEDPGIGADDANGVPLSYTRQWRDSLLGTPIEDDFRIQLSRLHLPFNWYGDGVFYPGGLTGPEWPVIAFVPFQPFPTPGCPSAPGICQVGIEEGKGHGAYPKYPTGNPFGDIAQEGAINAMPTAVDGSFKTSGLRNVELTGPFFHNGGQLTLDQVLEFYNRGGDFAVENVGNLSPNIHPLGLDATQRSQIVAFLKTLTDDRVRCELAPFDHPEIRIAAGARGGGGYVTEDKKNRGQSKDQIELIQATGAGGLPANFAPCLEGFLE